MNYQNLVVTEQSNLDMECDRPQQERPQQERPQQEVAGGFLYCHHRANTNTSKTLEVTAFAYALIEVLIEKGLVSEAELNERKQEVGKRLVQQLKDNGMGVMLQQGGEDKYQFQKTVKIDCENRLHLCKAACCRLRFALSQQDLEEGVVKWDLAHPYMIAQAEDGYCRHLQSDRCGCTVYENRPLPCRAYDCRQDARIWADFENRIVSPDLEQLFQVVTNE